MSRSDISVIVGSRGSRGHICRRGTGIGRGVDVGYWKAASAGVEGGGGFLLIWRIFGVGAGVGGQRRFWSRGK